MEGSGGQETCAPRTAVSEDLLVTRCRLPHRWIGVGVMAPLLLSRHFLCHLWSRSYVEKPQIEAWDAKKEGPFLVWVDGASPVVSRAEQESMCPL
jgi:hypothetical protein